MSDPIVASLFKTLSERETTVLRLIADEHLTNRQIGERIGIVEGTAEAHVHHILKKLLVHSRQDAARMYLKGRVAIDADPTSK